MDYKQLENNIFSEAKGQMYVGGVLIDETLRSILKDQAKSFLTTNLYEILDATVANEAFNLAMQGNTLEHLQYAKALLYWNKTIKKMLSSLSI